MLAAVFIEMKIPARYMTAGGENLKIEVSMIRYIRKKVNKKSLPQRTGKII